MMNSNVEGIKNYLCGYYLEREEVISGLLTAFIARENILLIGSPGEAKSEIVNELAKCFMGASYFQYLLTPFTTPEELFGPVKLDSLKQGVYERNMSGKMPEAHFVFNDEIFKSSSAILNAQLTIMNEKIYHNNGTVKVPLMSVVGASNEYPEEDSGLDALDDRFILRYEVEPVKDTANFQRILTYTSNIGSAPKLPLQDLVMLQEQVDMVGIDSDVLDAISRMRIELSDENIVPSTRTWRKAVKVCKAHAVLHNRTSVSYADLKILKHVLWKKPLHKDIVGGIVHQNTTDTFSAFLEETLKMAKDIHDAAVSTKTTEAGMDANVKFKQLLSDIEEKLNAHPEKLVPLKDLELKVRELQSNMLSETLNI